MSININQRGQALIESLVAIFALSILVVMCLSTLYFCFSKLWLKHFTHEALICMASQKSAQVCQKKYIQSMHSVLPFGRLMVDEFFVSPHKLIVRSRWSFGMRDDFVHQNHFRIKENQELSLPLSRVSIVSRGLRK